MTAFLDVSVQPAVLVVAGDLDIASADLLRVEGFAAVDAASEHLALDLSGVTFMDSTALGALVAVRAHAVGHDIELVLRGASSQVRRILAITGLDRFFNDES